MFTRTQWDAAMSHIHDMLDEADAPRSLFELLERLDTEGRDLLIEREAEVEAEADEARRLDEVAFRKDAGVRMVRA